MSSLRFIGKFVGFVVAGVIGSAVVIATGLAAGFGLMGFTEVLLKIADALTGSFLWGTILAMAMFVGILVGAAAFILAEVEKRDNKAIYGGIDP